MKATGENKEGVIWDSKLGTGTVERGSLKDILKINSDSSPDFGKADKAILLRKTISEKKIKAMKLYRLIFSSFLYLHIEL